MPNRLAHEKSLYLRQHADNPVDWFPWGEEALQRARREDRPLLVSVGYSSCHWCHVMAHESFEDPYIARLMNQHFVCVKVDREEHPDLDRLYMEAVQMIQGHGGWPLNVFCLPDGRPFAGGTYFPPDDRRPGLVPWPQLLMRVADFYQRRKADLEENAQAILGNLEAANQPPDSGEATWEARNLLEAARAVLKEADLRQGGFGGAPKFPPHGTLAFLLALRESAAAAQSPSLASRLDACLQSTLDGLTLGGLFDQIGGGFARYSVDAEWRIPHFEKMLYDNGQLLALFARAWRRLPQETYLAVIRETIAWLDREMRLPDGGYASALDADSEGEEGKCYVWTPAEIDEIIGEAEGAAFAAAYDITPEGNFEHGRSHARLLKPDERDLHAASREKLLIARALRVPPARDDKCLLAWNALIVTGLAEAAWTFGRRDWWRQARDLASVLWDRLRPRPGVLHRLAYGTEARGEALLADYAAFAEATLVLSAYADWVEPGAGPLWQQRATELMAEARRQFVDPEAPGWFSTPTGGHVSLRTKEWFDTATPAGNSQIAWCLTALDVLTGEADHAAELHRLRLAYPSLADRAPHGIGHALAAFTWQAIGIAVIKAAEVPDLEPLRRALVARPYRPVFLRLVPPGSQPPGYQLCVGTTCLEPTSDPREVAERL